MKSSIWNEIAAGVAAATGRPFQIEQKAAIRGGCINSAYRIEGCAERYFVKLNDAARAAMFEAEAEGLAEIARSQTLRVPAPICHGASAEASWLVLEYLDLGRSGSNNMRELGSQLARMHETHASLFGWHRDNTIGATPQINTRSADWVGFWRDHRLGYQLRLAASNGYSGALQKKGERLLADLGVLLADHAPTPSLLHGDLWGGNAGFDAGGSPVIYDPAVYYGDREADLAMTELFGGFGADFYAAYREFAPLPDGYAVRKVLYNLYHVLNHLNLFGGGYRGQAEDMMTRLLSEIG